MPIGNDGEWYAPDNWDDAEADMYEDLLDANPALEGNDTLEIYFHVAYFDFDSGLTAQEREFIRDELHHYLEEEYGIIWDDVFDWEGYREHYDRTH
jgi:hypothetical protein